MGIIHIYNAALSACTSAGFSTAGRNSVCFIDGLLVNRTGGNFYRSAPLGRTIERFDNAHVGDSFRARGLGSFIF